MSEKLCQKDSERTVDRTDSSKPTVTIITINWNNYEDTAACLESLEDLTYPAYNVVIVDNGSTDNSITRLSEEFDWCEFVYASENLGFAGGCNLGVKHTVQSTNSTDYILLLNNDTIVEPEFLEQLVCVAEESKDIACVGGVIKNLSDEIWFSGGSFIPHLCRGSHIQEIKSDEPYETDFITGAMMLINADFFSNIEGLNEDYFFGMEDLDLCLTAQKQNLKLLIAPRAQAIHNVSSSAGRRSPFKYYHSTRNRLQLASNHLNVKYRILFYISFVFTRLVRGIQWGLSGRFDLIRSVWSGIIDYLQDARFKRPEEFDKK